MNVRACTLITPILPLAVSRDDRSAARRAVGIIQWAQQTRFEIDEMRRYLFGPKYGRQS